MTPWASSYNLLVLAAHSRWFVKVTIWLVGLQCWPDIVWQLKQYNGHGGVRVEWWRGRESNGHDSCITLPTILSSHMLVLRVLCLFDPLTTLLISVMPSFAFPFLLILSHIPTFQWQDVHIYTSGVMLLSPAVSLARLLHYIDRIRSWVCNTWSWKQECSIYSRPPFSRRFSRFIIHDLAMLVS